MIRFIGGILGTTLTGMLIDAHMNGDEYLGGATRVTPIGGVPGFFAGFLMLAAVSFAGFLLANGLRHTKQAADRVHKEQADAGRT
jgi:uncharacterized membrane protein YgdD (TMEM256/DUF423 family)